MPPASPAIGVGFSAKPVIDTHPSSSYSRIGLEDPIFMIERETPLLQGKDAMEIQEIPVIETPDGETTPSLEEFDLVRIAFELWQQGSLPELAEDAQAEIEEVACYASCL